MSFFTKNTFRVFIPFAFGYFLSYLFRTINAVAAPNLSTDLSLNPSQLGLLTSAYFIAFALSQLPLGVLLDRFGPRIMESFLLIFASLGAFIFAKSHTLLGVITGRVFIGFGVSACLMAAFKAYVIWIPEKYWTRINGFQMAAGGLGALASTIPIELSLQIINWRTLFFILSFLTFCAAITIFIFVPEKKNTKEKKSFSSQINGIKHIFTSKVFWQIAPLATMSQAGFFAIQGLWAGPWLRDVAMIDRTQAANVLSYTAISMICGFVCHGFIAEKLTKKGISLLSTSVIGISFSIASLFLITFKIFFPPSLLWILFGFFGTTGILVYPALSTIFPKSLSGRVTTGLNLIVFLSAFCLQWAIGAIINLWGTISNLHYNPLGYKAGFALILVLQIGALIWYFFARKDFRRNGL